MENSVGKKRKNKQKKEKKKEPKKKSKKINKKEKVFIGYIVSIYAHARGRGKMINFFDFLRYLQFSYKKLLLS